MSKRSKKGGNKRGKNNGKSTKHNNAKQPRMEQPSTNQEHVISPVQVPDPSPRRTETSYPNSEQLTTVQKSELLARDLKPGESILARYLAADPGVSLRDLDAGPSTHSQDPEVEQCVEDSEEGPLDLSIHSEEAAANLTRDSGTEASDWPRDTEAGPSDYMRDSETGPSYYWSRDAGAGPSNWPSNSGAVPSTWSRDAGAGPSWSRDSGAGPSTQLSNLQISSLDYDPNLKSSIVANFLGIPKSIRDAQEKEAAELAHEARKYTTDEDSESPEPVPCDFKIPSSRLKRKISTDDPKPSTSKDDNQVSTSLLEKPNGNQISQNSSSISEKAEQEAVISSGDKDTLADSVQKSETSTADGKLEIRHVQDIEKEILQMDIVRASNNSPDFGSKYIQKLAASLLENDKPIVLDDNRVAAWPKKKFRVPYVFLHSPFEFRNHMTNVLERNIQFYLPERGTHYTKILNPSLEDQQNLAQYFDEYGMPYHTFAHPSEKMMRVVIRGLSGDIDLDKLKEELTAVSIPVERLHKMLYNGMNKSKWQIILAVVPHNEEGLKLLKVRKIFGQEVTLERAKTKTKQCHRCQRWGHAQRYCKGRVRCVKCAGDHFSDQCTRNPQEEVPTCANCGGTHTASYRQCSQCPDSDTYKSWQMRKVFAHSLKPVAREPRRVLATYENCEELYVRYQVDNK